ncbi:MAG TPA: STAS domain-containing protein [Chloroflexia bacterium]|nr:STAS domain-containing protein [Chloroflexia bacterium]
MDITGESRELAHVVMISGSLDAVTADQATSFLSTQIREGHTHLVVDLARLEYVSSAGLRVFLTALKEARQQGGDLRLAAPHRNVQKVLEMSGFTSILKLYADLDAALASYTP